jgi:hypothetical protein
MEKKMTGITKPTVVPGGVHGLTYWKEVVVENPDCRYIFKNI